MSNAVILDPIDPTRAIIGSATESNFGINIGSATLSNIHPEGMCAGRPCVVHNPTNHHMREWVLHWRGDRGIFERICRHGVGHPDPDQEDYWKETGQTGQGIHGCDGCC